MTERPMRTIQVTTLLMLSLWGLLVDMMQRIQKMDEKSTRVREFVRVVK